MRDYLKWHEAYDDPSSDLSWRLRQVQAYIRSALDQMDGHGTVLSLCAGDGRDVLQVLAERDDSARIQTTLLELHPVLAQRARSSPSRQAWRTSPCAPSTRETPRRTRARFRQTW